MNWFKTWDNTDTGLRVFHHTIANGSTVYEGWAGNYVWSSECAPLYIMVTTMIVDAQKRHKNISQDIKHVVFTAAVFQNRS
jgi:hypothetical protein